MDLTEEQEEIVETEGNIIVDAVAGSGKTSVALAYTRARPDKTFLYTCFNRSVRDSAESSFPDNVIVKNIHSLAYKETNAFQWEIAKSFDCFDVIDILKIKKKKGETNFDAKLAGHILRGLNAYFNVAEKDINNFDYLDYSSSEFSEDNIDEIQNGIRLLNKKMGDKDIPIIHNYYLKQFQIQCPKLDYDYIIADEQQDSSPCIMEILGNQDSNKLVLGDKFQAIYKFLLAENALSKFEEDGYQMLKLTQSFRFRQDIANLAKQIIDLKFHIREDSSNFRMVGAGKFNEMKTHACLSRSNLSLIVKAAEIVSSTKKSIHLEGNINSYMFADGVGIYDIFNMWSGRSQNIKNKFLSKFKNYEEYKEFLKEVGNRDQEVLCNLVERYKGKVFSIIKEIKERNVEKKDADVILSTVHKAKGQQYDYVEIADDFITERQILKAKEEDFPQISEEINILYTAVTRTKNKISFPIHYLNAFPALKESKK